MKPFCAEKRQKMIVGKKVLQRGGDEHQPASSQGGSLDQKLLPFGFFLKSTDEVLGGHRFGCAAV